MDCVSGELLIYRIKRCPAVEKEILFEWIRQLAVQISQYHRCHNDQCYRYINPYSVLITRDDKVMLLDLDAESNLFVLRNMQKRAMRNHFVKPIVHIRENTKLTLDLYGFGKTIQFMLASTFAEPSLSGREEHRLAKIIEKCLNENPKKQYEDFKQVQKELPVVKNRKKEKTKRWYVVIPVIGVIGVLGVVFWHFKGEIESREEQGTFLEKQEQNQEENSEKVSPGEEEGIEESGKTNRPEDGLSKTEEEIHAMEQYLLQNTVKGNKQVIKQGEMLLSELLRYLAAAYDREEMKEKALRAYQELCQRENKQELLETAYQRRIVLETELFQYGKEAVETGREAMERFPESEDLALVYLEAVAVCIELSEEERVGEAKELTERFPALKESECYLKLESDSKQEETEEKDEEAEDGEKRDEKVEDDG